MRPDQNSRLDIDQMQVFLEKGIGPGPRQSAYQLSRQLPKLRRRRSHYRIGAGLVAVSVMLVLLLSLYSSALAQAIAMLPGVGYAYRGVISIMGIERSYALGFANELGIVTESQGARITVTACFADKEGTTALFTIERLDGAYLELEALKMFLRGPRWLDSIWPDDNYTSGASAPAPNINGARSYGLEKRPLPRWYLGGLTLDVISTDPRLPGRWVIPVPVQRIGNTAVEVIKPSDIVLSDGEMKMTIAELHVARGYTTLCFDANSAVHETKWSMQTRDSHSQSQGALRSVAFRTPMGEEATFRLESYSHPVSTNLPLVPGARSSGSIALSMVGMEVDGGKTIVKYRLLQPSTGLSPYVAVLRVKDGARTYDYRTVEKQSEGVWVVDFPVDVAGRDATLEILYMQEVECGLEFTVRR